MTRRAVRELLAGVPGGAAGDRPGGLDPAGRAGAVARPGRAAARPRRARGGAAPRDCGARSCRPARGAARRAGAARLDGLHRAARRRAPGRIRPAARPAAGLADRLHRLGRAGGRAGRRAPRCSSTAATRCRSRGAGRHRAVRDPPPDRASRRRAGSPRRSQAGDSARLRPVAAHAAARSSGCAPAAERAGGQLRRRSTTTRSTRSGRDRPPAPLAPVVPHPLTLRRRERRRRSAPRIAAALAERRRRRRGADRARIRSPGCSISAAATCRTRRCRSSFAILHGDGSVELFIDRRKLAPGLDRASRQRACAIAPPDGFGAGARRGSARQGARCRSIRRPPPSWVFDRLDGGRRRDPSRRRSVPLPKACKNPVELEGTRAAHRRDGAARDPLPRLAGARGAEGRARARSPPRDRLEAFRRDGEHFRDLSFDTISGAGPNGAIVHYRATPRDRAAARAGHALSGRFRRAVSRRHHRHHPHGRDRRADAGDARPLHPRAEGPYRARARRAFPKGTTGIAARRAGARARCGRPGSTTTTAPATASAAISSVHEGPQRISKAPNTQPLLPGMIVSNEPGYYKTGAYGIRIENLVVVTSRRRSRAASARCWASRR